MKNIGYTLKRYKIWVIAIIIVILAIVSLTKSKTRRAKGKIQIM